MTVAQLILSLQKLPQDAKVYKESGDFADDWREVQLVSAHGQVWQFKGVFLQ
jgi:hypothetical protein